MRSAYRRALEAVELEVLDVYRLRDEKGVEKDVIRILHRPTSKVIIIDLGRLREAMSPEEFMGAIRETLEKAGIRLHERRYEYALRWLKDKVREWSVEASEATS